MEKLESRPEQVEPELSPTRWTNKKGKVSRWQDQHGPEQVGESWEGLEEGLCGGEGSVGWCGECGEPHRVATRDLRLEI